MRSSATAAALLVVGGILFMPYRVTPQPTGRVTRVPAVAPGDDPTNAKPANAQEQRINNLEAAVKKLESKPKDAWDKFQILAAVLIPASISLAGYFFAKATKDAELNRIDIQSRSDQEIAKTNARVLQAELVTKLIEQLTSANPATRQLSLALVKYVIPDAKNAEQLLQTISQTDPDAGVRQAAATVAMTSTTPVIGLFSDDEHEFEQARSVLRAFGSYYSTALVELLALASKHPEKTRGLLEALQLFSELAPWRNSEIIGRAWNELKPAFEKSEDEEVGSLVRSIDAKVEISATPPIERT
jgi:hypothetical protein